MSDVFSKTASKVVEEIENDSTAVIDDGIDGAGEDIASQIEYLSGFDPKFKDSQEYQDLIALQKKTE